MTARNSFVFVLEIVPLTALTHGMGTAGNEQLLRTQEYLVPDEYGELEKIRVPEVSGAAMRATLREAAVWDFVELLKLDPDSPDGTLTLDRLRLLAKGGRNDAGGATVSVEEMREMRRKAPLLALFGAMDGGQPLRGLLSTSPVRVWCEELVSAGLAPKEYTPTTPGAEPVRLFASIQPPPQAHTRGTLQNFRHDMRASGVAGLLPGQARAALEDKSEARASMKVADKETRRDANESMPYAFQTILPGTPMFCEIRLSRVTDVELGCFQRALERWIRSGAHLGGGANPGRGRCRVAAVHGWRTLAPTGFVADGERQELMGAAPRFGDLYAAQVEANAAEVREWLAETKADAKAGKGKGAKTDAKPGKGKGKGAPAEVSA